MSDYSDAVAAAYVFDTLNGSTLGSVTGTTTWAATGPDGRQMFVGNGSSYITYTPPTFPTTATLAGWFIIPTNDTGGLYSLRNSLQTYGARDGQFIYAYDGAAKQLSNNLPDNTLFHLAVRVNGTNLQYFINGVSVGSTACGNLVAQGNNTLNLLTSHNPGGGVNQTMAASVCDFGFWTTAISNAWIMGLYTGPVDPPVNTVAPVATYNSGELSTTDGTWTESPVITYQWQRFIAKWTDISAATSDAYTPTLTGEYRCKIIATGDTVVNAYTNSVVLEIAPVSPTPYSVYTLNGNKWPEAGSVECESEILGVADEWEDLCPIVRTNTIYFDADDGDDENDGLTTSTPKQTLTELTSILAPDTTYRLKGIFRTGTPQLVIDEACTITKWEGEDKPRITGLRLLISANSAAWTVAAGNRWTTTLTNATSLHRQDHGPEEELKIAASTAEVEANVNSYYITGSTISVNIGSDPNLVAWECNHSADYGSVANGIVISGDRARIDNVICDHNGYSGFLTSTNQSWGIQATQSDDEVVAIVDCECYGHRLHNIGHLLGSSQSGGRTLFKGCRFGGCTSDFATLFVDYADNGENECILVDCVMANGRTSAVTLADISQQRGLFSHATSDSYTVGFMASVNCSIDHTCEDPVQDFGNFGNVAVAGRILDHYRAIHIKASGEVFDGHRTVPFYTGNIFVSSYFHIRPKYTAQLGVSAFVLAGMLASSTFDVDWVNITPPAASSYGLINGTQSPTSHIKAINSEIRFKNGQELSGRSYVFLREGVSESIDKNTLMVNSVLVTDADVTNADYVLTLGNDESLDAVFDNNCLYGWVASVDNKGYSGWLNSVELDSEPLFGELDPRLLNTGSQSTTYLSEVDRDGIALITLGSEVGPWGIVTTTPPELRGQAHIYMQTNNDLFSTPAVWHNPPTFYNYQWQILNTTTGQWDDISGATTNTLTPPTVRRWYRCKITAYYSYAYSPSYFYKIEAPNTEITVNIVEDANLQSQQIATGLYAFQSHGNVQTLVEETYLNNRFKK